MAQVNICRIESTLNKHLCSIRPSLGFHRIDPEQSLTSGVGLDSLDLVELAARIKQQWRVVDLTAWLAQASLPGQDTLRSLAIYVATHCDNVPDENMTER